MQAPERGLSLYFCLLSRSDILNRTFEKYFPIAVLNGAYRQQRKDPPALRREQFAFDLAYFTRLNDQLAEFTTRSRGRVEVTGPPANEVCFRIHIHYFTENHTAIVEVTMSWPLILLWYGGISMKQVITTENIPIKLWLDDIEDGALVQAENLANLPFAFKHIALMPDTHLGYGMPIGGVLATENVIVPNAVGVDIGCGVRAVKTGLTMLDQETIKIIMGGSKENHGGIRSSIPVGYKHHSKKQAGIWMPSFRKDSPQILYDFYEAGRKQVGTLGGGNHFIEIQKGSDGFIWLMIHSGSRNIGYQVANYFNDIAEALNEKWFSQVPKVWGLAFLPLDTQEGQGYLKAMDYCVEFARCNRALMMRNVKAAVSEVCSEVVFLEEFDVAHNYAALEHHFGRNVVVHRKGATKAMNGQLGIIPGSQGTSSFIVEGLGNPDSFMSCSHGAGRKMGRKQAIRELNLEVEKKRLDDQGIVHSIRNEKDLDEAAGAYKDIDEVMENQKDLVVPFVELKPLAVIKG
ncbi:MAG: RtcB family protein [Marinobacter sp.]